MWRSIGKQVVTIGSFTLGVSAFVQTQRQNGGLALCQLDPRAESEAAAGQAMEDLNRMISKLRQRIGVNPFVDHTLLKPDATPDDVRKLCQEAVEHGFASVCVSGSMVQVASEYLQGRIKVCAVVGFPTGQETPATKVFETEAALKHGASEIDMVINVGRLKAKDYDYVLRDIAGVVQACKENNAVCKVIIETCLLTEEEKQAACLLTRLAGADFVKTSTGFSTGGATVDDVKLMKGSNGITVPHLNPLPKVQVKASGGVRSYEDAMSMLEAGATRLGTSSATKFKDPNFKASGNY